MSLDRAINVLVTITLIEMMVLLGLQVTFTELAQAAKNWWLLARAAMANYVLFPAVTIALLMLFDVGPMLAAGFLVLAVCPGAPYGPRFAAIACANVPIAVGLMAMLLHVLLPWVSGGEAPQIDAVGMLGALLAMQLLPLLLGLTVKHRRPQFANRLLSPLEILSNALNLSVAGLILGTQFRMLTDIPIAGFAGMLLLLAASLVIGWLAGGPARDDRRTLALTTSLRNVGLGLVIVTGNFADSPAVSAALAYGIVAVLGSLVVAVWWARQI